MINPNMFLVKELLSGKEEMKAIREGYGQGLVAAAQKDDWVVALGADLRESLFVEEFAQKFPKRYVEVGVAEQNMMGIAAGMAAEGLVPFVNSYAVFSPGRNWDQLRVSVCYSRANVKVVGGHAGITVGPDGATHQALEDIAITRVLPNMTVIVPMDAEEARKATVAAAELRGPVYIRLSRAKSPIISTGQTPFEIGKAQVLRYGEKVTIAACGLMVYEALRAAEELDGEVINVPTVKPLDVKTILSSIKKTGRLVVAEEHQRAGGLFGAITEALAEEYPVPSRSVAVADRFGESGEAEELLVKYGLTWEEIVKKGKELVG